MDKKADYIKYPNYIGGRSFLTVHEEQELRKEIAKANLSDMTEKQKKKLFKTCNYYLAKSLNKLNYMELEAKDQFADIIENGYRCG